MINDKEIILSHAERYPNMQPTDAVKLVYQMTFGGGHVINDEKTALMRIKDEYRRTPHKNAVPVCESLGDTSRIYLNCIMTESQLELTAKIFTLSAKFYAKGFTEAEKRTQRLFLARLSLLSELCGEGIFSFSQDELDKFLEGYRMAGYPAVSHSEEYRKAYCPAYRVIDSRYVRLIPLIFDVSKQLENKERIVLAIDGRAASGKTTAAGLISKLFNCEIIHMDDFFLPRELRTEERLSEVGGNVHYERFSAEVLPYLRGCCGFSYRTFNCSKFDFDSQPRTISPAPLYIVEGSYSLHPGFGEYYDLSFFSDVPPGEQLRRIRERNGEKLLERFKSEWIPMEERYFSLIGKGRE